MLFELLPSALGKHMLNEQVPEEDGSSLAGSLLLSPPQAHSDEEEAAPQAKQSRLVPEVSDSEEEEEEETHRKTEASRPAAPKSHLNRHRADDAEFNALVERCKQQEALIEQIRAVIGAPAPTAAPVPLSPYSETSSEADTALVVYNPLQEFELEILLSTHDPRGRRYVPGGPSRATRLGTTSQKMGNFSIFPHVLFAVEHSENEYMLETDKNTTVRCRLIRKSDQKHVSERELLAVLNSDLSKPPIQSLTVNMALKFHACEPNGDRIVPDGIGPQKTFDRVFSNGNVPAQSQLLDPPENVAAGAPDPYSKTMSGGAVSFTFKVRSGVTSQTAIPKRSQFVVEVSFTNQRLRNFPPAVSPPFWIKSKFSSQSDTSTARLDRGEMWVESLIQGGPPERVPVRKRPRQV